MTSNNLPSEIEALKSEIQLKNTEIYDYLVKIEYLEDLIMEIETDLAKKSDVPEIALKNIQIKELARKNRELKNKMGFLRMENIRLKKELEKSKKGYFESLSLIQVLEDSSPLSKIDISDINDPGIKNDQGSEEISINYLKLGCPICDARKILKIPIKIINPSQKLTMIRIPKGMFCDHCFQVLIDSSFNIKKYQVANLESSQIEFYKLTANLEEVNDDLTEIVNQIKSFINDRDILGTSLFDHKWNLIFASIPPELSFNVLKEFEIRKERSVPDMINMYIELSDHKKIFSEHLKISDVTFILALILSEKVNFGMGRMLFRNIKEKLTRLTLL